MPTTTRFFHILLLTALAPAAVSAQAVEWLSGDEPG
jgi:hypothetical protein